MADFNKAKVEKKAKQIESTGLEQDLTTDNKSCVRAIARFKAGKDMYPELSGAELAVEMMDKFYKGAKFQPSWEKHLQEHAPELLDAMKNELGSPSKRGRKKSELQGAVPVVAGTTADPDAQVGPVV